MIQYRRSLRLDSSSTSAVLIKTRTNVCHGITAHTLWGLHGEHQVNTEKLYQRVCIAVLGVWSIFAFIIKCILRIFPCSFGNKRMRLLTHVYGKTGLSKGVWFTYCAHAQSWNFYSIPVFRCFVILLLPVSLHLVSVSMW